MAGASDSLGDLLVEDPAAVAVLDRLDEPVSLAGVDDTELARRFRHERLRIAARDLLGIDDLSATVAALSGLADALVDAALALVGTPTLTVVGMGKYGARELNFVSDVDLVFVSDGDLAEDERAARRVVQLGRKCIAIDTRLRPEGRDGPLVRSVDAFRNYWERWASAWEFQALLKAQPVAGPLSTRAAWSVARAAALWGRPLGREMLHHIRQLKSRSEDEVRRAGRDDVDLKRSPGGIRDIEFSVQLLQLVHGAADPTLRVAGTRAALDRLVAGGYVDPGEAAVLSHAYLFLRRSEHRLQLVAERQTHDIPERDAARARLARAMGRDDWPSYAHDLAMHRLAVRDVHQGWYFRPLLDAFAGLGRLSPETLATRLAAFGFRSAERTEQAVAELTRGLTRSSQLMRQLLPLVFDWLSKTPDPDQGLLGLRRLASEDRIDTVVHAFRDSAETARRVCVLVGTSPLAVDLLEANSDVIERLDDVDRLGTGTADELRDSAWSAVDAVDPGRRQGALHAWHRRHLLGVIARDIAGDATPRDVSRDLTALADAVVATAVRLVDPPIPFAIIALGRLGRGELGYASDLDLLFVHDAGPDAIDVAERTAGAVMRLLSGPTPATRIFAVDPDLRPEGRQGALARSLDSYTVYLERWAEVWERQTLLAARTVAGDGATGRGFATLVDAATWSRPPAEEDRRSIRRMKARVERERIPLGVDPRRHLKLGPGALADVEWTVELLQWGAGVKRRRTEDVLTALVDRDLLDDLDGAVLAAAHRTCDELRNRSWLMSGNGDVLPEAADDLARLALSLDTDAATLVDRYRRDTRRARRTVERIFYGYR